MALFLLTYFNQGRDIVFHRAGKKGSWHGGLERSRNGGRVRNV